MASSYEKLKLLRVYRDSLELLVGNWPTPLLRLKSLSRDGYEVWAKLEFFNPFSRSIKDRTVWNMIRRAFESGVLRNAGPLYEATSGNVGIAMACMANVLGLKFRAYIPMTTPKITEILLKFLGAEVKRLEFSTIDRDMVEYVILEARKDHALNLNQYENDANVEVHMEYTAQELCKQLDALGKEPDVLIAGIGTSGHIVGLTIGLRKRYRNLKVVGVQPAPGSRIPGIKRVETKPKWLPRIQLDEIVDVSTEEAIEGCMNIARGDGILIGLSSGAVVKAFEKVRNRFGPGTYILIFPDDIFKYVEIIGDYLSKL